MRYEEAFVELAVAATIVVEKLPTHREYHTVLHGEQRRNLAVNGTDILDSLSMLKGPLVEKHEWWLAQQISTLGVDDRPKANPATASLLTKVEKGRTRHALQAAHTEHAWRAQNTALEHKGAHFDASPDVIPQVAESPVAIPSPEHTSLPLPDTSLLSETIPEKYGLKAVRVPKTVLTRFLEIVKVATQKGEEACGLLLGKQKGTRYVVTTLLVPKQHATVRGCTMDDEELISQFTEERSLMTLGWIHTHPTQPCFMSSDDLHVHAIFQSTLPEAFAMVCAPNSTPTFGIFRLLDPPGLQIILDCEATKPFHPHPDVPLYTVSR
ncbi:Mov34-domain-containing protein [Phanerochaete sordida]|uniref:Mov34-domain-containing protein n=1 Tax=Phanerochaete sordida TaxID=48140 RepID=A0A9P3G1D9_9APHY|nr:Mov34-domain-containing protein [Phanerochaete sordida]